MHHARSNTLILKTQTMTASEKSEGNTKRTSEQDECSFCQRHYFYESKARLLGFTLLPNLAPPDSCGMLMLPTSSGSNIERDTCTSEFFKKSYCMIKRNI